MEAFRTLFSAMNQLATTAGLVWWRCLPRLLLTALLGWLGYRIFAQLAAMVVEISAWWSLLMLSLGFVVRLSSIIIGLRIAGEELHIRQAIPLPEDDPRDNSVSDLLSKTLLPFLGIYAVFDVVTDAANAIQVNYYLYHGLTWDRPVLAQLSPQGAGIWVLIGVIAGLYVARRLIEFWYEKTGFRPIGLLAALVEGFFMLLLVLSGRQVLVSLGHWIDDRTFRVWLDYPVWGMQQVFGRLGIDISGVLNWVGTLWGETLWPAITATVIEPMLWLALAALVFGSQVLSVADVWRRGRPVTVSTKRSELRVGNRQRRAALEFQEAFFGDLNDKYLPTFQSIRLVFGVGATFFGAYILCYGLLAAGTEWLRRGMYTLLGGHPATFWAMAEPPLDLIVQVVFEPMRWVLLATAFHACLSLLAARGGQAAAVPDAPTRHGSHDAAPDQSSNTAPEGAEVTR